MRKFSLLLEEQNDTKVLQAEVLRDSINMFNNRKSNLESLILSNIDDNKDISKNVSDIVEDNVFLSIFKQILTLRGTIVRYNNNIKDMDVKISDIQNDVYLINKVSDDDRKKEMLVKIKQREDGFKKKRDEYKKTITITDTEREIKEVEVKLADMIKEQGDKIKELLT